MGGGAFSGATSDYDLLAQREREVLKLAAEAKSTKYIAEFLTKLPVSSRCTKLETWVRSDLADRFRERLLAIDGTVAATWGNGLEL